MFEDPVRTKKYLKIAAFGKGGTGKTRFGLSFPGVCVIDGEHSTDPYRGQYEFKVYHTNRWMGLKDPIEWLKKHPGAYQTLFIDPGTIFYNDLINDLIELGRKKRGTEEMTRPLWNMEKRRWFNFCNVLTELPMHVIVSFREADVYADQVGQHGEEILRKTGEVKAEVDKQMEYLFDLSLRFYTEENKKEKRSNFYFQVQKSRYDWMPKYAVYEMTKQRAYDKFFAEHVAEMLDAPDAPQVEIEEPFVVPDVTPEKPTAETVAKAAARVAEDAQELAQSAVDDRGAVDRVGEALEKFAGGGDPDAPLASAEDIKVLLTRASDLSWPDGTPFKSDDGKKLLKGLYKIASTKELKKFQCDFLFREFGEVLAGRAILSKDETGVPFVQRVSGAKV